MGSKPWIDFGTLTVQDFKISVNESIRSTMIDFKGFKNIDIETAQKNIIASYGDTGLLKKLGVFITDEDIKKAFPIRYKIKMLKKWFGIGGNNDRFTN